MHCSDHVHITFGEMYPPQHSPLGRMSPVCCSRRRQSGPVMIHRCVVEPSMPPAREDTNLSLPLRTKPGNAHAASATSFHVAAASERLQIAAASTCVHLVAVSRGCAASRDTTAQTCVLTQRKMLLIMQGRWAEKPSKHKLIHLGNPVADPLE